MWSVGVVSVHLPKPPAMTTTMGEPSALLTSINSRPHIESIWHLIWYKTSDHWNQSHVSFPEPVFFFIFTLNVCKNTTISLFSVYSCYWGNSMWNFQKQKSMKCFFSKCVSLVPRVGAALSLPPAMLANRPLQPTQPSLPRDQNHGQPCRHHFLCFSFSQ